MIWQVSAKERESIGAGWVFYVDLRYESGSAGRQTGPCRSKKPDEPSFKE
ncbi:hypothetical protein GCWU000341_01715 [Oribacterium sp. oral taxon 078 str. F0262]|nr:hypothetical protein GCWU000341_01715 [Oribacterium sp. oral taxon 078 str. F0262]